MKPQLGAGTYLVPAHGDSQESRAAARSFEYVNVAPPHWRNENEHSSIKANKFTSVF